VIPKSSRLCDNRLVKAPESCVRGPFTKHLRYYVNLHITTHKTEDLAAGKWSRYSNVYPRTNIRSWIVSRSQKKRNRGRKCLNAFLVSLQQPNSRLLVVKTSACFLPHAAMEHSSKFPLLGPNVGYSGLVNYADCPVPMSRGNS